MAQVKFENRYSRLDRLLYRVAFSSGGLQVSLADVEGRIYRKQLAEFEIKKPVFITALPRAGTTILLNLIYHTDEFVSHTYRSMPFVLCPLFWRQFSIRKRSGDKHEMERAHGDGIAISVDSPEAFEEMIWSHFWKPHYREDHIEPWAEERHNEFPAFLHSHIRKQMFLSGGNRNRRYLSKNNLNIARLDCIRSIFPDAIAVVLFRSPLQHASSLLKQHLNFLQLHKEDKFSKDYMRGIGHYDFGANFLPVNFDNWLQPDRPVEATSLVFWLQYWIAAYKNILEHAGTGVHLLSFDRLTQYPKSTLQCLAGVLQLEQPNKLIDAHVQLREPPAHALDEFSIPGALLAEANGLYDELMTHSAGVG